MAANPGARVAVRLYTKPGCHLCVELVEMITSLPGADRIDIEQVDIEQDDMLFEKYRYTIPVLELPDGVLLYPPHSVDYVEQSILSVL